MSIPEAGKARGSKPPLCGNWPSAISADTVLAGSLALSEPRFGCQTLYYIERRPDEGGRCVIVAVDAEGRRRDLLPAPYSARSRVHEYGGGVYCILPPTEEGENEQICFCNDADQGIYRLHEGEVRALCIEQHSRFADLIYDPLRQRLIAVREIHHADGIDNQLVAIDCSSGEVEVLQQGEDFYASARLSPDGKQLCWLSWNQPDMPWDGNRLWLADFAPDGRLLEPQCIAGGEGIACFQPQWAEDAQLYYAADPDGWWQLYRHTEAGAVQLSSGEKEIGQPQWVFAQSSYALPDSDRIIAAFQQNGRMRLGLFATETGKDEPVIVHSDWQQVDSLQARDGRLCFIGAADDRFAQLVLAEVDRPPRTDNDQTAPAATLKSTIIRHSARLDLDPAWLSRARNLCFHNRHGQPVYARYYPPAHPDFEADPAQPPPLIVICHGGPTGQSSSELDPRKLYWTSRGFALLDVNYSGSTGYGRAYRERLNGRWGELDVQDCCDAALYAVAEGLADGERLIIRGSSAGGFTVLAALTFENVFAAGASYYGISDLSSLASDTHKFEARYLDRLVGPWPEAREIYARRSPINHAEQLDCPVIFFQGLEDKVVPPAQAQSMVAMLKTKGLPVAAQYFPGEQHGFRQADTIKQCLHNELVFYRKVLGLGEGGRFIGDIEVSGV